jgi:hypothetical protein
MNLLHTTLYYIRMLDTYARNSSYNTINVSPCNIIQYNYTIIDYTDNIVDDMNDCSICLLSITYNFAKLSCNHYYHIDCINKWFVKNNTCPLCRIIYKH